MGVWRSFWSARLSGGFLAAFLFGQVVWAEKPRVVFLIGEDEYKSEATMPRLARELEGHYGFECILLHDQNPTSVWKPEVGQRANSIPGLDVLQRADLLVLFMRFRTLPEDQVAAIQAYLDAGKPVVAFRTSTHAFNYAPGDPLHDDWNAFGARVLGAPWIRHYGHESSTDVSAIQEASGHPILKGVAPSFHVRSWLYHVLPDYPPKGSNSLLMGRSVGPGSIPLDERSLNPVAWTRSHPGGGKVFMTTIGHPEDFEVPAFQRLVVNGVHWALGLPVPGDASIRKWGQAPFELRDGDRVILVGDTLIERERYAGYIETLLTARFPGRRLVFRNLGWAADTVDIQERPLNFGDLRTHVVSATPTVVLVSYGLASSFDGEEGLPRFLAGYEKILDMLAELHPREVVLLSPVRHEDLGPPFPNPAEHNQDLQAYTAATGELARKRGYRFVDLYHGLWEDDSVRPPKRYTENGVHLSETGYWAAARLILKDLGLSTDLLEREAPPEALRRAVVEKNQMFFYRWRAHNGEYIYGRRSKGSGDPDGQGNSGNDQFPAEMAEFERLIAETEGEIMSLGVERK